MALYQASLFDTPREPVLAESSGWITGLLSGPLAVSLCVIAVALLGMLMLTGRLPLRRGAQVVVGCFLLWGSFVLTGALAQIVDEKDPKHDILVTPSPPPTHIKSPALQDPYAGASLRRN